MKILFLVKICFLWNYGFTFRGNLGFWWKPICCENMFLVKDHSFPFLFPQGFQKCYTSLDIEFWELGAKRGLNRVYKWKEIHKKLFLPPQFCTLKEQKLSNLRLLLSITFPQGFPKSKQFGYWPSGSGGEKTVKRSEKVRQRNKQTNRHTHMWTFWFIERIWQPVHHKIK